jgi:hypothetical protein
MPHIMVSTHQEGIVSWRHDLLTDLIADKSAGTLS